MSLLSKAMLGGGILAGGAAAISAYNNSPDEEGVKIEQAAGLGFAGGIAGAAGVFALSRSGTAFRATQSIAKAASAVGAPSFAAEVGKEMVGMVKGVLPSRARVKAGWKALPAKGIILPIALGTVGFAGIAASQDPEIEGSASAIPDGMGGRTTTTIDTGIGNRARLMNATGDVTLGLHRGRH